MHSYANLLVLSSGGVGSIPIPLIRGELPLLVQNQAQILYQKEQKEQKKKNGQNQAKKGGIRGIPVNETDVYSRTSSDSPTSTDGDKDTEKDKNKDKYKDRVTLGDSVDIGFYGR